jgi:hypothetical protein
MSRDNGLILSARAVCRSGLSYSRKPGFTETRLRPLARRRDSTARPLLVFMRERNPCVFERRRRLGWNVRFGMRKTALLTDEIEIEQTKSITASLYSWQLRLTHEARQTRDSGMTPVRGRLQPPLGVPRSEATLLGHIKPYQARQTSTLLAHEPEHGFIRADRSPLLTPQPAFSGEPNCDASV